MRNLLTVSQAFECAYVCQMLSDYFQVIQLFRYDKVREIVYIIAGNNNEIKVIVPSNGKWEFDTDED